jgi:hypothetical protein
MPTQYPESLDGIINPNAKYKPAVLSAVSAFARSKPWAGTVDERKAKFAVLHAALCGIYERECELIFASDFGNQDIPSGRSSFNPHYRRITLCGRSSVVTYLHEFAHALGKNEFRATSWSVNLFARKFPRSFAAASQNRHLLVTDPNEPLPTGAAPESFSELLQALGVFPNPPEAAAPPVRRRRRRAAAECPDDQGTNC